MPGTPGSFTSCLGRRQFHVMPRTPKPSMSSSASRAASGGRELGSVDPGAPEWHTAASGTTELKPRAGQLS
eukprot:15459204-Alexandrium_andersonii.AAC.1